MYKALDSGDGKPPELSMKYWEELQTIRQSEESKRKSQQLGNQARKRGLRNTTKEKIKQATVVKLVSETTELQCKHLISFESKSGFFVSSTLRIVLFRRRQRRLS